MMKKTEIHIQDILLHDVIDVTEKTTNRNAFTNLSKLKRETKYPIDIKLTFPINSGNMFKGICFITDFEGSLKFLNPTFLSHRNIKESWFVKRNVMDFIHTEDLPMAIENLIKLIQEDDSCISFQCRTGFDNKIYTIMNWNITCSGQLLFFDISGTDFLHTTPNDMGLKEDTLEDLYFDAIYWKMEVSKSINDWDKKMSRYLDFCTEIKRK